MLENVHTNLNRDRMNDLSEDEFGELRKLAVLDTGVDLTHEAFQHFVENGQLDEGYDFVDRGMAMTGLDGHGTHCCHLIFKTAPYAKVYPLKVFRSSKRETITPTLIKEVRTGLSCLCRASRTYVHITKAIYFTIETLDVDIISMSFAFEEEEDIKEALYHAKSKAETETKVSKPVLMLAAASNNRVLRLQPIGYPARVNDRVLCVNFSTAGDQQSSFSPHGVVGFPNLSAIGENVETAQPTRNGGPWKRMSGTSCSTPVVTGIAALILDFSKEKKRFTRTSRSSSVE